MGRQDDVSARLGDLAARYWEAALRHDPLMASTRGRREFDAELPDLGLESLDRRAAELRGLAAEAAALPEQEMTPEEHVTRLELISRSRGEVAWLGGAHHRFMDSRLLTPQGWLLQVPTWVPLRSEAEAEAFRLRVGGMEAYLARCRENLVQGLERGVAPPRRRVESAVDGLEAVLAEPPKGWALARHAAGFSPGLGDEVGALLEAVVAPAFRALHSCLREQLLPASRGDERAGLAHLPEPAGEYARAIEFFDSCSADPAALHREGLEELARVQGELLAAAGPMLGVRDIGGLREALGSAPELFFASSEQVLAFAEQAVDRALEAIPAVTGLRPEAEVRVQPIPEALARGAQVGYYTPPAPDGSAPGIYHVNTSAPETRRRVDAEMIAFHESVPGHHLQLAVAQTLELPDFRRLGGVLVFCEGWATYAEGLADELGLYSDPRSRLGPLMARLWRASRQVLDTGLHHHGWGYDRVLEFAWRETPYPRSMIEDECSRHLGLPGQPLAYGLGSARIRALRAAEEERQGAAFSLPDFHDRVLGAGALSLDTLSWWVEEGAPREG